ncbi:hypothetical protein [Rhodococcus pyridinivorans]|nr:hypothetical protein [Rhodococcus pyridinivorans]
MAEKFHEHRLLSHLRHDFLLLPDAEAADHCGYGALVCLLELEREF